MSETPSGYLANGVPDAAYRRVLEHEHRAKKSELAQAVQEADAMEAALAAPLFDGVRADMEAVLNGLNAAAWARVQDLVAERDAYLRAAGEQVDLRVAADKERDALRRELGEALKAVETWQQCGLDRVKRLAQERLEAMAALSAERDEARHAKAQMELRWQAAEKECAALRAKCEQLIEERNEARLLCARAEGQIADAMFMRKCEKCR